MTLLLITIAFIAGLIAGRRCHPFAVVRFVEVDTDLGKLKLRLAYQRIDELEERCSRLHLRLLEEMKRRRELADLAEIREGDYGRFSWVSEN